MASMQSGLVPQLKHQDFVETNMTGDIRKSFESLLKNGEYAEAERLLNEFIEQHPEDREAKVLFGTCRMLQGDTEFIISVVPCS